MAERGTVKWFDEDKHYGFITPDIGREDIFFHRDAIEIIGDKTIEKGERVEFEVGEGPKGPQAKEVRLLEE